MLTAFFSMCSIGIISAQVTAAKENGRLFYLSFDDGLKAVSTGKITPENDGSQPQLTDGIHNKAAGFKSKSYLEYSSEQNVNKAHGTISMWVKWPELQPGQRYTIFKDGGIIDGESTALWLTSHERLGLQAGIGNRANSFIYGKPARLWKKNEWHHVVLSWNINRGLSLYLDGVLAATKLLEPWQADLSQFFSLGGSDDVKYNSWGNAIDEVKIFDHELSNQEVYAEYEVFGKSILELQVINPYVYADKADSITLMVLNRSAKALNISDITLQVFNQGKAVYKQTVPAQSVSAQSNQLISVGVVPLKSGYYPVTIDYVENKVSKTIRDTILAMAGVSPSTQSASQNKLLKTIDATVTKPVAESSPSVIVKSTIGSYREAGNKKHDRFALEFHITDINKPHVAIFKYPDDKPRTMEIILQDLNGHQDYQAQTGVICGDEYPNSNLLKEFRILFWPKSKDQSFIFMTAENNRPAAVSEMAIYQVSDMAPATVSGTYKGSAPARSTGIYYEDPVLNLNFGENSGIAGFSKSTQLLLDYMQSFGQTQLNYPVAWYNGPLYNSGLSIGQADVGGARPHPVGYVNYFLKSLQARGMKFNASLHLHTLPGLEQEAITSKELVATGTETVLNVRSNGAIFYNRFHGSDPGFNPLDPKVEKAVSDVVSEVAGQFAKHPAFNGITLVMARVKLFGFGSLESGYNDINLQRFQQESGIVIPAYKKDNPNRFAESYVWLMGNYNAKQTWINWRCAKLHEHYKQLADKLSAYRKDLKLTLNVFVPVAFYARAANYLKEDATTVLKESGFDPGLYKNDANIVLSFTEVPADYRLRQASLNTESGQEAYRTVFTAPNLAESLKVNTFNSTTAIVHDRYWEDDIAKKTPLKFVGYDNAVECKWRVSTLNSSGIYSLEPYVFALNNMDAISIDKGGFLIGTMGMENELLSFSSALQKLPAVKFDDVSGMADPVRVRQKEVDGQLYFYVLNCVPTKSKAHISFNKKGLIEEQGSTFSATSDAIDVDIEPYGLKVFKSSVKGLLAIGGQAEINKKWLEDLTSLFLKLTKDVEQLRAKSADLSSQNPYIALAQKCFTEKKYSRLYFMLQEGWVKEINKMLTK